MADETIINKNDTSINEAVCIDTKRIYDSCVSKDCLEDLRVTFYGTNQDKIDNAVTVKCRDSEVKTLSINVEEVPFNHGYYGVEITFYFRLEFDTYTAPCTAPIVAEGYAQFSKKCILYGSDGNVKVFTSNKTSEYYDCPEAPEYTNPVAKVQTVDPVILSCDVINDCDCHFPICVSFPQSILRSEADSTLRPTRKKAVIVTLGLFSIVQMERDVQILIPAYNYCIPERECDCNTSSPCDTFSKIDFPVEEFFPPEKEDADTCCPQECANS